MVSTLLPLLLSTAYFGADLDRPSSRLLERDFALGLRSQPLYLSRYGYVPGAAALVRDRVDGLFDAHYRPWAELLLQQRPDESLGVQLDKDSFRITLDVRQFKPEELELKLAGKYIVVSAKHEEKKDEHGLVSRQFVRRYYVPENVDAEQITSSLSPEGLLTIRAPVKQTADQQDERPIKIEYTGEQPAPKPAGQPDDKTTDEPAAPTATGQPDSSTATSSTPEN